MDYLDPEDRGRKLLQNIVKYSYLQQIWHASQKTIIFITSAVRTALLHQKLLTFHEQFQ